MSDNPVNIIDEYLALVREKLPKSIADDVITELETYMLEAASDQSDDEQITLESAKKVVAQFGAPGEVADEYRYSMLPETIPEEDIPPEILKETSTIDRSQQEKELEKTPTRELGVDPTTEYSIFFFKSFSLTIMWAVIIAVATTMIGPIWFPNWQLFFIIIPVIFVTIFLLAQTLYLKRKKVILWKRSYPDWSIFQKFVTLPENSVPDAGTKINLLDLAASLVGVILFIPVSLQWNSPMCVLIGTPASILLISRITIIIRKLEKERDPYEKSRYEFGINFSLLIILESTVFWMFNTTPYWNMYIYWLMPFLAIFIPLFGTVLLFQILTGAQNLWWKTDNQKIQDERESIEVIRLRKETAKKDMTRNGALMFGKITGWLVIFNSVIFYACGIIDPSANIGIFYSRLNWLFGSVLLVGVLVILYFLFRNFRIEHLNSSALIGRRTRLEAVIDLITSSILLAGLIAISLFRYSRNSLEYPIYYYYIVFGFELGRIIVFFELILVLLVIIALGIRIVGNILEFKSKYKISAAKRIEESGLLILVALPLLVGGEFIEYLVTRNSFFMFTFYILYWVIAIFIAFQVVSSDMKIKEMTNTPAPLTSDMQQQISESNEHAGIAN